MKKCVSFLILFFLFSICIFSQERALKVVAKTNEWEILNLYEELKKLDYGYLVISSYPPTEVEINGKSHSAVPPLFEVKLPEGRHTFRFINLEFKIDKTIDIELLKRGKKKNT